MPDTTQNSPLPAAGLRFHRRTLLKMLATLPAAGLLSRVPLAHAASRSLASAIGAPGVATTSKPHILNPHEWTTVCQLCDWIVPADDDSAGAGDAGVPEFIDDWLDFQRGALLTRMRDGLAQLDAECIRLYGVEFSTCEEDKQRHILDRMAWPESASPQDAALVSFFSEFRDLVLSGFYTSETGIRYLPYIGNEPQREWTGCPTPVLERLELVR